MLESEFEGNLPRFKMRRYRDRLATVHLRDMAIPIPSSAHNVLKALAAERDITLKEVITHLIEASLAKGFFLPLIREKNVPTTIIHVVIRDDFMKAVQSVVPDSLYFGTSVDIILTHFSQHPGLAAKIIDLGMEAQRDPNGPGRRFPRARRRTEQDA